MQVLLLFILDFTLSVIYFRAICKVIEINSFYNQGISFNSGILQGNYKSTGGKKQIY